MTGDDKKQIFIDYVIKSIKDRVIPITSLHCLDLAEFYCNKDCPIRDEGDDGICYNEECLEFMREFGRRYRIQLKVMIEEADPNA